MHPVGTKWRASGSAVGHDKRSCRLSPIGHAGIEGAIIGIDIPAGRSDGLCVTFIGHDALDRRYGTTELKLLLECSGSESRLGHNLADHTRR